MTPPRPPAHVAPFVDALGEDLAVTFLLTFGGAEFYFPATPRKGSALVRAVGWEGAQALCRRHAAHGLPARIPTAKPWIARVLSARGLPVAEIARKLHTSDVTVRSYLADRSRADQRQLPLI